MMRKQLVAGPRRGRKPMSDGAFAVGMMVPAILLLAVIIAVPILKAIYISFFQYGLKQLRAPIFELEWNSFQNYIELLKGGEFLTYFSNTLLFCVTVVSLQFVFALMLALLLNQISKCRGLLRGLLLIPWTIPSVVTAILWRLLTNQQFGTLNYILVKVGILDSINFAWTIDAWPARILIILACVWRQMPYMMVMLLAALQSVDRSRIEAARIDGANSFQVLTNVLLPGIRPVLITALWLAILSNFQMYTIIANLTGGGPADATTTLAIGAYDTAFRSYNFGESAAIGVCWLIILFVFTLLCNRASERASRDLM